MHRVLSAFFTPEVLGAVLLAMVGVFVFLLVRPSEQDSSQEFWLRLVGHNASAKNPGLDDDGKQGVSEAARSAQVSDGGNGGYRGF